MNNRYLLVSFLLLFSLTVATQAYSQNCLTGVTYKVVDASPGRADGSIHFQFAGSATDDDRYVILNLTAAGKQEREDKIKLPRHEAKDLPKGNYEFVIVDRKKDKCSKEISVEIKESQSR
ncbi:MAG: hypothetical protein DI538_19170 [Azospira oryzae]|jgi:hypothetical protein|nr:MAG: hypothetical protein DI538_19170 [Azospira oryzae]